MNDFLVCTACGTQTPAETAHQTGCLICQDDRQYVPPGGQAWTTPDNLLQNNSVRILKVSDQVYELTIVPQFAIGQRALLVLSEQGNILWDCIPLLNEPAIAFINAKGGLKAIALSHPHYYSNMANWAETFDCPIYIHQSDQQWVTQKSDHVRLWDGLEQTLWDGIRIINIGGHFPGSSILHVPHLSKDGCIFCGDTLYVALSKKHIAVMYSYPNRIPLPLHEVERIKSRFESIPFDTLYGFYSYQNLTERVKELLNQSLERYLA